jgi:YegS C-terminal NAD kinase beta sandwich-like domain
VTIRKGEAWGEAGGLPADGVVVRSDAEARAAATAARRAGRPVPTLGLLGGDLCRTLGGRGDEARLRSGAAARVPADLGSVLVDGVQHWFVAHLVARRSWWWGRIVAAMNAEFLGGWDVAPRAHPGDGLLDVVDVAAAMSLGDRLRARRRLPSGGHVPHPAITVIRRAAVQVDFDRTTPVWLDGERVGDARRLSIRIERDALVCVV